MIIRSGGPPVASHHHAMLRTFSSNVAERVPCQLRTFASSVSARSDAPFSRPGPIPLPKEEQKEFEKLVRDKESMFFLLTK